MTADKIQLHDERDVKQSMLLQLLSLFDANFAKRKAFEGLTMLVNNYPKQREIIE